MKLSQLLYGIQAFPEKSDAEITGVTNDSRKITPGCVFFCIQGTTYDGHLFASDALKQGAAAVVTQRRLNLAGEITVTDTHIAYATAAANYFGNPAKKLKLVGVTGTNGKTTTTMIIRHILITQGFKTGIVGTIQNMINDDVLPAKNTTPDAYELQELFSKMVDAGCTHCVMEVSSHALAQDRVGGCHFDVAVFTNLTQDHLDYHGDMESYMLAKRKLFTMCDTAVVNSDDEHGEAMVDGLPCRTVTYSAQNDNADYTAKNIRYRADGVNFILVGFGDIARVKLHTPGLFSVYNAIASALCAHALGIPFDKICESLLTATGVKGRVEVVPTGRNFTVIIDYAHTHDGLVNIISALKASLEGRLVVLFGCGGDRDRTKRPLMAKAVASGADFAIVTSDNPRTENPADIIKDILPGISESATPYLVIENRREAIFHAIQTALPGDLILLAGKGHETYQILATETIHFDEREVVADALKTLPPVPAEAGRI